MPIKSGNLQDYVMKNLTKDEAYIVITALMQRGPYFFDVDKGLWDIVDYDITRLELNNNLLLKNIIASCLNDGQKEIYTLRNDF